jgi:hypothetical protein
VAPETKSIDRPRREPPVEPENRPTNANIAAIQTPKAAVGITNPPPKVESAGSLSNSAPIALAATVPENLSAALVAPASEPIVSHAAKSSDCPASDDNCDLDAKPKPLASNPKPLPPSTIASSSNVVTLASTNATRPEAHASHHQRAETNVAANLAPAAPTPSQKPVVDPGSSSSSPVKFLVMGVVLLGVAFGLLLHRVRSVRPDPESLISRSLTTAPAPDNIESIEPRIARIDTDSSSSRQVG